MLRSYVCWWGSLGSGFLPLLLRLFPVDDPPALEGDCMVKAGFGSGVWQELLRLYNSFGGSSDVKLKQHTHFGLLQLSLVHRQLLHL